MTQTAETFFEGGAKAAKFTDQAYGMVIGGRIVGDPRLMQQRDYESDELMFYGDGNPVMQMVAVVQAAEPTGDDDGQRSLYIKGQMKQAVGEALRKVGAKTLQRDGSLWIKYVSDEPVTLKNGKKGNDKKIFAAKYEAPAAAAGGQFFGDAPAGGAPAQASADSMRSAGNAPAPGRLNLTCPTNVDPAKWAQMTGEQQQQMYDALGLSVGAPGEPVGGAAFADAPPF